MEKENQNQSEKKFRCFKCGAQNPLDARYCLNCGTLLLLGDEKKQNKESLPETEEEEKRDLGKKKVGVFLLISCAVLVFLASLGFWFYTNQQKKISQDYQEKVNAVWEELYNKTLPLAQSLKTVKSVDDFSALRSKIIDLQATITTQKFKVDREIIPSNRFQSSYQNLKNFLEDYSAYFSKLEEVLADPIENGSQDNLLDLQDKAQIAQKNCQNFEDQTSFLSKSLPKDVFDTNAIRQIIIKFREDQEAQKKQELNQKEQDAALKVVADFLDKLPTAYTQADPYLAALKIAKSYWAATALNVFENRFRSYFNDTGYYWNKGKILNIEKMGEGKYMIICEETIKNTSSTPETTTKLTYFIVEKINNSYLITSHGDR